MILSNRHLSPPEGVGLSEKSGTFSSRQALEVTTMRCCSLNEAKGRIASRLDIKYDKNKRAVTQKFPHKLTVKRDVLGNTH